MFKLVPLVLSCIKAMYRDMIAATVLFNGLATLGARLRVREQPEKGLCNEWHHCVAVQLSSSYQLVVSLSSLAFAFHPTTIPQVAGA